MFDDLEYSLAEVNDEDLPNRYNNASTNTPSYERQKERDYNKLLTFIREDPSLSTLLQPVSEYDSRTKWSQLFRNPSERTKNIFNQVMKKFAYKFVNEKLQPSTLNVMFKRIFSKLKDLYNINWNFQSDFSHTGGFGSLLVTCYREKAEQDPSYGNKPTKFHIKQDDREKLDGEFLGKTFDENITKEFTTKILFIMGRYNGLRGRSEHTQLSPKNYLEGNYPTRHPLHGVAQCWVEIMPTLHKTHRITLTNNYKDADFKNRIPVFDYFDPSDIGGSIYRYYHSMHPHQKRFYCYPATKKQKIQNEEDGLGTILFSPSRPIGENTLAKYFKEGATKLGIKDSNRFQPHSLRNCFVTVVSNNAGKAGLDIKKTMEMTHHNAVSSLKGYIEENEEDEVRRVCATGIQIKKISNKKKMKKIDDCVKHNENLNELLNNKENDDEENNDDSSSCTDGKKNNLKLAVPKSPTQISTNSITVVDPLAKQVPGVNKKTVVNFTSPVNSGKLATVTTAQPPIQSPQYQVLPQQPQPQPPIQSPQYQVVPQQPQPQVLPPQPQPQYVPAQNPYMVQQQPVYYPVTAGYQYPPPPPYYYPPPPQHQPPVYNYIVHNGTGSEKNEKKNE